MAGDWIKMRCDLADDPAVVGIAGALDIEEDLVVGKLHRLWAWANRQTEDGNAPHVTLSWLDRYISVTGFADAMVNVGWLVVTEGGILIPDFDKHNSKSAKKRAITARRVAKHRVPKCNADSVTREEKRREEKSTEDTNKNGKNGKKVKKKIIRPPTGDHATFIEWFHVEFAENMNFAYDFTGGKDGKDGKHVKELLALMSVEELKTATSRMFDDPWARSQAAIGLGLLRSQINKYRQNGKGKAPHAW